MLLSAASFVVELSVRFLGKTADFAKRNDISNKTSNEEPGTTFYGEQNPPAKDEGNYQIRNDRQKKFHGDRLIASGMIARVVSEVRRGAGPGALATLRALGGLL